MPSHSAPYLYNLNYGASKTIIDRAKALKARMTPAEKAIWQRLKNKQILGLKFRRQHPIDMFIVDFYCHSIKLVIEIDGEIHNYQKAYDNNRTAELERLGIKVIRFTNREILNRMKIVINKLTAECRILIEQKSE